MDKFLQVMRNDISNILVTSNVNGKEVFLNFDIEDLGLIFAKLFSYKGINSRLRDIAIIPFAEGNYKIIYNIFIIDELTAIFLETELKREKDLPSITKFYKNANFLERKIKSMFDININNSVMGGNDFFRVGICTK